MTETFLQSMNRHVAEQRAAERAKPRKPERRETRCPFAERDAWLDLPLSQRCNPDFGRDV